MSTHSVTHDNRNNIIFHSGISLIKDFPPEFSDLSLRNHDQKFKNEVVNEAY